MRRRRPWGPQFPVYVVSKGRHDTRLTARTLESMRVPYLMVVEEQEVELYARHVDRAQLLVLDPRFQRDYDTFDDLGDAKSRGPGPARNFAWEHAKASGARWHWVMDDNIKYFFRLNHNLKVPTSSGAVFAAMEDFCLRYTNVVMAGPNYFMFASRKTAMPPFVLNTRIYSCNLIRNDLPFRWRGRYNEDTDLSLRVLKAGLCTVQFNAFLQGKTPTQQLRGGNTDAFYAAEGTLPKSRMLAAMHPDVARVVPRFGRAHHYVDYRPFKGNVPVLREGAEVPVGVDDYGLVLERVERPALAE